MEYVRIFKSPHHILIETITFTYRYLSLIHLKENLFSFSIRKRKRKK